MLVLSRPLADDLCDIKIPVKCSAPLRYTRRYGAAGKAIPPPCPHPPPKGPQTHSVAITVVLKSNPKHVTLDRTFRGSDRGPDGKWMSFAPNISGNMSEPAQTKVVMMGDNKWAC